MGLERDEEAHLGVRIHMAGSESARADHTRSCLVNASCVQSYGSMTHQCIRKKWHFHTLFQSLSPGEVTRGHDKNLPNAKLVRTDLSRKKNAATRFHLIYIT